MAAKDEWAPSSFEACSNLLYRKMVHPGMFLTSIDKDSVPNVMAIGWGLWGWFYHDRPIFVVAVTPQRYTWSRLEQIPQYVVSVPGEDLDDAVEFTGTHSGRDMDKFREAGLTPMASHHVRPPSIAECVVNIECQVYHAQHPPHNILTPEHRQHPLAEQHTLYFAEVLGVYAKTGAWPEV